MKPSVTHPNPLARWVKRLQCIRDPLTSALSFLLAFMAMNPDTSSAAHEKQEVKLWDAITAMTTYSVGPAAAGRIITHATGMTLLHALILHLPEHIASSVHNAFLGAAPVSTLLVSGVVAHRLWSRSSTLKLSHSATLSSSLRHLTYVKEPLQYPLSDPLSYDYLLSCRSHQQVSHVFTTC